MKFFSLFLFLFLLNAPTGWSEPITGNVEIHVIDVGQGDAILVMSPNKECVMLIDSGDTRYPGSSKNFKTYMQNKLPLGSRINLVVASHPHSDHIGSMRWVLQNYKIDTYIDNGQELPRQTKAGNPSLFGSLMSEVEKEVSEGQLKHLLYNQATSKDQDFCPNAENLDTVLLFPSAGFDSAVCDANPNNCSLVVKMVYGNTTFLFSGDAEDKEEKTLLDDPTVQGKLSAQFLKASHHGSDTSSSDDFLQAISPKWIVVSVGKKKTGTNVNYMHPRLSTIRKFIPLTVDQENPRDIDVYDKDNKAWALIGISGRLFETAKDGSVVLLSDGNEIKKK